MNDPIFRSVSHALRFAWLIKEIPACAKSQLGVLIDIASSKYGVEPVYERTINWDRLNPLEVRGSCSMIRSTCERLLPPDCYMYVLAKYSLDSEEAIPAFMCLHKIIDRKLGLGNEPAIVDITLMILRNHSTVAEISRKYHDSRHRIEKSVDLVRPCLSMIDRRVNDILSDVWRKDKTI